MIRFCSVLALSVIFNGAFAQVFWSEDFGSGDCFSELLPEYASPNGNWSAIETGENSTQSNNWRVSAREAGMDVNTCGESCMNDASLINNTLHISTEPIGDTGASYLETGFGFKNSDLRAESPVIDCTNRVNIILDFTYFSGGVPGSDFCTLEYYNGSNWEDLSVLGPTETNCAPKGTWTEATVNLPSSANNNPNVKIGFRWINVDDGVATDLSVAIDNITLSGVPGGVFSFINVDVSTALVVVGACVDFSDQTEGEGISDWLWTFEGADPSFSFYQNPAAICYLNPGQYDVTLQLNFNGEVFDSTFSNFITVVDTVVPVADFDYTPIVCVGQCYSFENTSTGGDAYFWSFDGALPETSEEEGPAEICYDQIGTFDITLTVMNDFGSSTSITQQITVVNPPNLNAGPDQYITGGTSAALSATGGNGTGNFNWEPAELVTCSNCSTTSTVPLTETTTFTVGYEQSGGCMAFDEMTVIVDSISSVGYSIGNLELFIYPNPGNGEFMLVLPQSVNPTEVEIFDMRGNRIHSERYNQDKIPFDLSGVSSGIYFVRVASENIYSIAKVVKQ